MNLLLISGSPKPEGSSSEAIPRCIAYHLGKEPRIQQLTWNSKEIPKEELQAIVAADAVVFSFPLYVDGIPSHLMYGLDQLQGFAAGQPKRPRIYAVVNCGFFEGEQTEHALKLMRFWSRSGGFEWGGGIGIGAGSILSMFQRKSGRYLGPNLRVEKRLAEFARTIIRLGEARNVFVSPALPDWVYQALAHQNWKAAIKRHGKHPRLLSVQLPPPERRE